MDAVFIQQTINAISLGAIYALFALGYAMVFSILGVLNLAHSAIFMWGAFIGLMAIVPTNVPILLAFSIAALVVIAPAFFAEWLIFRRAIGAVEGYLRESAVRLLSLLILVAPFLAFSYSITFNVTVTFNAGYVQAMLIPAVILLVAGYVLPNARDNAQRLMNLLVRIALLMWLWIIGDVIFSNVITALPEEIPFAPLVALVIAVLGGGILSVLLEFAAFRPLRDRGAERLAQLISSIGAALVLVNIAQFAFEQLFNRTDQFYPRDVSILPGLSVETIIIETSFGDVRIAPIRIVILVIALVLMVALQYMVTRTQIGQQMRAVAFNQRIASLLGINVSRVYIITFFLAGAFGGAAGILYGLVFSNVTPFIGDNLALIGLTAIVLGGLGSINGAVLGGFIVAALQTFSTAAGGSSYRDAIVFILLFLVLLIRPQGLLGQPENTRA